MLTVDGQVGVALSEGEEIRCTQSEYQIDLIQHGDKSFFDVPAGKVQMGREVARLHAVVRSCFREFVSSDFWAAQCEETMSPRTHEKAHSLLSGMWLVWARHRLVPF